MSFETQLKTNYAQAHFRLLNGLAPHQEIVSPKPAPTIRPPEPVKQPIKIQEFSPLFTDAKPTIYDLLRWVSKNEGVSVIELRGPRHSRRIALARQIVCYLARTYAGLSSTQIGNVLGHRDHTTVLSGANRIKVLRLSNEDLCFRVALYELKLDKQAEENLKNYNRCPHCGGVILGYPQSVPK